MAPGRDGSSTWNPSPSASFNGRVNHVEYSGTTLYLVGEYEGMVFVEGFARQRPSPQEGDTLKVGGVELRIVDVPGHAPRGSLKE